MAKAKRSTPEGRVTLNDVAKAAGVSVMTVSNVINGKHVGLVGQDTLRRVKREVKRLGYVPHEVARSLRLSRSFSVGMIIVTRNPLMLAAPFVATLVTGVATALRHSNYSLITESVHPDHFDRSALLRRAGIEGIVAHLAGSDHDRARYHRLLKSSGLPLVFLQDRVLIGLKDRYFINQDDFHGGRMLAHLALDLGAKRLLFVKPSLDWPGVIERERGVRSVLADRGTKITFDMLSVEDEGLDAVQQALAAHLQAQGQRPDFILCSSDHLAVASLKLAQSMGLRVPEDIGVTGFNNFEFRRYTDPALTTVQSEIYDMGFRAGAAMVHRIEHGAFVESETTLPVSLVLGGSTAPLRSQRNSTLRQADAAVKRTASARSTDAPARKLHKR